MRVGSLFSGIGLMDLGLERAGMEIVWQVEIDEYCRQVLEARFPRASRYADVRSVHCLEPVDLVCGGFPCPSVSRAGYKQRQRDERWLWPEMARIVCELRPRFVLVENVMGLLDGGIDEVLGDLADIGFDAEWSCVSACSLGAPHMRQRVFIVAYPYGEFGSQGIWDTDAQSDGSLSAEHYREGARARWRSRLANPSELYRGAHGVPYRLERNRALGNGVVPGVAEYIGRMIMEVSNDQDR